MSHKARILKMLEAAGDRGISSKILYREFMGRGAARIKDLRNEGFQIDSDERDPSDPKYCIYRLIGSSAGQPIAHSERANRARQSSAASGQNSPSDVAHASGGEMPALFELPEAPKAPSAYDPYGEAA